ncbi:pirin family protein [Frankia sp. CNm7]|uniref:Pirin family protein n=1 Tax=Frankia nepalensis TaxID=1836974 RepID=A0A937RGI2_9ACTN|nr:pirin family protein [Frankia nepalensis]MBL7499851.1 pirin family protein [Frankia nepalensis]MBL7513974.1 pirin family protein [Frankia nepalensis]MBL7517698.1 pirin family protein [Frankia nepalensis]MBL7628555.1 pirin family protein [Frankia nepalensis]
MSGPVTEADAAQEQVAPTGVAGPPSVEITEARAQTVGAIPVRRVLPIRARRTVGAWCFADHMGPLAVGPSASEARGVDIGPHPHTGLHTVTWLLAGEVRHLDSLGSEQVVRPGQLNLMTAGHGVAHAEEGTDYRGTLHGVQLWVAQPEGTRHGPPAFEHHAELPRAEVGVAVATVLVGEFGGAVSPARRDTELVGADLEIRPGRAVLPLRRDFEHALLVTQGAVRVVNGPDGAGKGTGKVVRPGQLAYLGQGRDELALDAGEPARALLLGGVPFAEPILMWWNFVARTRAELTAAFAQWESRDDRFGAVDSSLNRVPAPPPPWR